MEISPLFELDSYASFNHEDDPSTPMKIIGMFKDGDSFYYFLLAHETTIAKYNIKNPFDWLSLNTEVYSSEWNIAFCEENELQPSSKIKIFKTIERRN